MELSILLFSCFMDRSELTIVSLRFKKRILLSSLICSPFASSRLTNDDAKLVLPDSVLCGLDWRILGCHQCLQSVAHRRQDIATTNGSLRRHQVLQVPVDEPITLAANCGSTAPATALLTLCPLASQDNAHIGRRFGLSSSDLAKPGATVRQCIWMRASAHFAFVLT
jgi:hypothetical protein